MHCKVTEADTPNLKQEEPGESANLRQDSCSPNLTQRELDHHQNLIRSCHRHTAPLKISSNSSTTF